MVTLHRAHRWHGLPVSDIILMAACSNGPQ
jgi:hypothetical protein